MLADKIFNLPSFKRQYEAVLIISASNSINGLCWEIDKNTLLEIIDWNNLLGIASILSTSENGQHLDAALRISQTCLSEECTENQKSASAIILETLTNKPAIQLSKVKGLIKENYKENIPLPLLIDTARTSIENSIIIRGNLLNLNKFQKKVHNTNLNADVISISAPTSAGKSFILYHLVIEQLVSEKSNIIYIVPTRALISQVEKDLKDLVKKFEIPDVFISTVPQIDNLASSNLFIFTQERLHWFLIENRNFKIDYLLVDEAHKIDDDNRGILLQQKIEEVTNANKEIRICYSSPFTSNPEILYEDISESKKKRTVETQFVSVNQNLLYITQVPRKVKEYKISLLSNEKSFQLGKVTIKDRPGTSEYKKLAFLSEAISSNNSGSIIYSNGAAEAENIAQILYDIQNEDYECEKTSELIKLIQKTIHKDYSLAKVLKRRIAFHYGNMPLIIRQEIEELFKIGTIKYLICTSTLLEGVNLPSKSIFIRKPKRGRNHPLNENDFWNLAGRAGRWGKEFNGNIVCIDPMNWEIPPNPQKKKQKITKATQKIKNNPEELFEYLNNGTPREVANNRQDLEFASGYYYIKYLDKILNVADKFEMDLKGIFDNLSKSITIPDYIIKRNPGISPFAQQALYNFFEANRDSIDTYIPVYPEDENAYFEYSKLVGIIGTTIASYPEALNNPRSILLINWMNGKSLNYLISSSYNSYQSNPKYTNKTLPVVIREVMENVENFVRFRFAKDSSCYVDILRYFLELNQMGELTKKIPELNLWLEFGVSQKTHLSLLSLGISRNSVIELSEFITNSEMSREECIQWIKSVNLNQLPLSRIIIDDIHRSII